MDYLNIIHGYTSMLKLPLELCATSTYLPPLTCGPSRAALRHLKSSLPHPCPSCYLKFAPLQIIFIHLHVVLHPQWPRGAQVINEHLKERRKDQGQRIAIHWRHRRAECALVPKNRNRLEVQAGRGHCSAGTVRQQQPALFPPIGTNACHT